MIEDIRWKKRFSNYNKAMTKLASNISYVKENIFKNDNFSKEENPALNDIVKQGLIQSFEYTHELAWNVMKDFLEYQGYSNIRGSRDTTREAFHIELIKDGDIWMDMISSRNKTSHTYNEETANEIFTKIINKYYPAFGEFQKGMQALAEDKL